MVAIALYWPWPWRWPWQWPWSWQCMVSAMALVAMMIAMDGPMVLWYNASMVPQYHGSHGIMQPWLPWWWSKAMSMGFDWNFIWILWDAIARPWASFGIVSGSYETSLREHVDPILVVLGLHLVLTELRWDSFGIPWVYIWIFWCSFGFVWASLPGCLGTQHRFFGTQDRFFWHPFWVPKGPSAR